MACLDKRNKFLLVPDLGLDRVMTYSLSTGERVGTLKSAGRLSLPPGSGPRHLALHPASNRAYVLNELLSTVVTCDYNVVSGELTALQTVDAVPGSPPVGVDGQTFCSAIRVSGDGKFVYVSNRGHCSISVFEVDEGLTQRSCTLTAEGEVFGDAPLGCQWPPRNCPRDFALCDKDRWAIVGNQDSDSVVVLARDASTGALSPTGVWVECAAPACVLPLF
ncbi:unnamed protein product [Effrenium voratum]|nr:unnamed protein product [Effrenium voratum]